MTSYECDCIYWKHYAPKLNSIIIFAGIHGHHNTITRFHYCPWCGEDLFEAKK